MIAPDRAELFDAIAELCRLYPDWRLGQLVSNVAGWADVDIWDIEDEQLVVTARAHIDQAINCKSEAQV